MFCIQRLGLNMKNYGDSLGNCNDNVKKMQESVNSIEETQSPDIPQVI